MGHDCVFGVLAGWVMILYLVCWLAGSGLCVCFVGWLGHDCVFGL